MLSEYRNKFIYEGTYDLDLVRIENGESSNLVINYTEHSSAGTWKVVDDKIIVTTLENVKEFAILELSKTTLKLNIIGEDRFSHTNIDVFGTSNINLSFVRE